MPHNLVPLKAGVGQVSPPSHAVLGKNNRGGALWKLLAFILTASSRPNKASGGCNPRHIHLEILSMHLVQKGRTATIYAKYLVLRTFSNSPMLPTPMPLLSPNKSYKSVYTKYILS